MQKIYFKISLKNDIIFQKYANTQGLNESLDFISGSVFLGLVAQKYDEFSKPFEIFHSAKVRFSSAKALINGKMSYKIPLTFFTPKNENNEIYNALFCDFNDNKLQDLQLKQIRSGYINTDLQSWNLRSNYKQKVNLHAKGSKDNKQMFGYEVLPKGLEFAFWVGFDESVSEGDKNKILGILQDRHFIGKSKNAEFGEVLIEKMSDFSENLGENSRTNLGVNLSKNSSTNLSRNSSKNSPENLDFLYINSPLALFENARPSFNVNARNLGLESGEICWEKTQIKTRTFAPFNAKRREFDATRAIIEQGSVIAVSGLSAADKERVKCGVGGFLSEGYGEILVNPAFLLKGVDEKPFEFSEFEFKNPQIQQNYGKCDEKCDENLVKFLQNLKDLQENSQNEADKANEFIEQNLAKFNAVKPAQWGAIRAFVQFDENYKEKIAQYTSDGVAAPNWEDGAEALNDFVAVRSKDAVQLLSMLMPKMTQKNTQKNTPKGGENA